MSFPPFLPVPEENWRQPKNKRKHKGIKIYCEKFMKHIEVEEYSKLPLPVQKGSKIERYVVNTV